MSKILEVKEFDKITGNPDYQNNPEYTYLEEPAFSELITFIQEFTATDENVDALECLTVKFLRGPKQVVLIKNYVGLIQLKNGYQIQVLPKIELAQDAENNFKTKKNFIKMLRCMYDFQGKSFNTANLNVDKMNLYEIFINMYLQEVNNLVKHGLKSAFIAEEDNLLTLRGKLNIKEQISQNSFHKEKLYCIFDEYQVNRPENKLIKSTLLKLYDITERIENRKSISQLLSFFEMVDVSLNYDSDFHKVSIDRAMKDYELILNWSKIFLKNKSFSTFAGESASRALLFPMEKLFEGYVAKYIKRVFGDSSWTIQTQDKGYYLFDDPSNKFALKPDIVITRDDGTKIILDTKWKRLYNSERENYGISQADMYQMYAYAKKYNTPDIWLLYPVNEDMANHAQITFQSNDEIDKVVVKLFFIDVDKDNFMGLRGMLQ